MSVHNYIFASAEHGQFTPDGKVSPEVADVAAHNAAIDAEVLAYWQTAPDRFAPAYFHFPAEHLPLFGRARPYRAEFRPCLYTYIDQASPDAPGVAHRATVTTWIGAVLGVITSATVYRHNFGGRFVSIRMRGSNGAEYYGRASWDGGDLIRLRKVGAR